MATNREIALEQALIMVIGAAKSRGYDEKDLVDHATALLLGNNILRRVEHPHVEDTIRELSEAHAEVLSVTDLARG